jgi:hypothetical protein
MGLPHPDGLIDSVAMASLACRVGNVPEAGIQAHGSAALTSAIAPNFAKVTGIAAGPAETVGILR